MQAGLLHSSLLPPCFDLKNPLTVMPRRSSRFYLFGCLHYYGHIRLPRSRSRRLCSGSHVHVLPARARHHIQPRMSSAVLLTVYPSIVAGFDFSERLANIISVTRLNCSSLQDRFHRTQYTSVTSRAPRCYFSLNGKLDCEELSSS